MQTKDETSEVAEESAKSKTEEEPPKENMMTKVSPRSAVSMRACICLCFVSACFQACTYTTPMTHTVIRAVCVCARARVCACVCDVYLITDKKHTSCNYATVMSSLCCAQKKHQK